MQNKNSNKTCKKCKSKEIKKDGFKRGKQRYKCKNCNHVFQNKSRQKRINIKNLWNDYCFRKQTYSELSKKYGISIKTVQNKLDKYNLPESNIKAQEIVLLIDTTYFGDIGVMAFKDSKRKKILTIKLVKTESYSSYKYGVDELIQEGWIIKAIVCDGKRGLLGGFGEIPTQMCNFHQVAIVTRYITKKPRLEGNKDLRKIALLLSNTDKETFEYELNNWYIQYSDFIKEKAIDSNGKSYFIHKRTRSAYFSLKRNLNFLFTWYDYYGEIDIPNTTNGLEGFFSHLKNKVSLHRGLKKERKIKLILSLLIGDF